MHPHLIPAAEIVRHDARPVELPAILRTRTERPYALATDFMAFTPGVLHTHGNLDIDPIAEFVASHPDSDCDVGRRDFPIPLFRGIARDSAMAEEVWDRRLYFIEHRFWDDLLRFLQGIAMVDRQRQRYAEVRADLVQLKTEPGDPFSFCTALGYSSNVVDIRITGNGIDLPQVIHRAPEPAVVRLAAAAYKFGPDTQVAMQLGGGV